MTSRIVTLMAVGLLIACQSGVAQPPPETEAPAPLTPQEVPPAQAAVAGAPTVGFVPHVPPPPLAATLQSTRDPEHVLSAKELRWVKLRIQLVGAPSPSELALEFVAPGELTYERRTAILSGSPYETQVVEFDLAVAGTMIDQGRMYGTWNANFFLDGQPVAADSFDIQP